MTRNLFGKIVRINFEEGNRYHGKQGVVRMFNANHEDGPYGVVFPRWYRTLQNWDERGEPVFFKEVELVPCRWWDPVDVGNLGKYLEGSEHHTVNYHGYPLAPGRWLCEHEDCPNTASLTAFENYWGTIVEHYVCPTHAKWHRCRTDDGFPGRQDHYVPRKTSKKRMSLGLHSYAFPRNTNVLFGKQLKIVRHDCALIPGDGLCELPHKNSSRGFCAWYSILVREEFHARELHVCQLHAYLHGEPMPTEPTV